MKNKSGRSSAHSQPMSIREKRQMRLTLAVLLIITVFMLVSAGVGIATGGLAAFSAVRLAGIIFSFVLLALSFSSAFVGEWGIGMLPPALCALWVFLLSRFWNEITAPQKGIMQTAVTAAAAVLSAVTALFAVLGLVLFAASLRTAGTGSGKEMTMVVLGCRLVDGEAGGILLRRLKTAEKRLKKAPEMMCILAGGNIQPGEPTEAEVMKKYLLAAGIDESRLLVEDRSTTTYENMRNCKAIAEEKGLPAKFAIVTDRFHQLRVRLICRDNGIDSVGINSEVPAAVLLQYWSREVLCLLEKWIKRL